MFIDKTERVYISRVRPHELYYVHTSAAKQIAYMDLVAKPLDGRLIVGSTPTVTTHHDDLGMVKQPVASVCF